MTERTPKPIPRPRKLGACAITVLDVLSEHGVTTPRFFKTKHARVEFEIGARSLVYHFPCTPRSDGYAAKRTRAQLTKLIAGHAG